MLGVIPVPLDGQMVVTLKVNIQGLERAQRRLENPSAVSVPVRRFLQRSGDHLQPRVIRRIRRRTGAGRASVMMEMDPAPLPRWVKVFSKLYYIRFYEWGTKRGQRPRRPFRRTLRASRKVIFGFAADAGQEIAQALRRR